MKNILKILTIAIFGLIIIPCTSYAIGQITSPIIIDDALRGNTYEEELTIINTEDKAVSIDLKAEGGIADWTTFIDPEDSNKNISSIQMEAQESVKVIAKFNIPSDTDIGDHKGVISVIKKADNTSAQNESTANLSQKVDREVLITISDKENIDFKVYVIPENYDIIKNKNLKIRIIYNNQGNISISPDIQIKLQKENNIVYNTIFAYPENLTAVKSHTQMEVTTIEIPLNNLEKGKYIANLSFYEHDFLYTQKEFYFTIREEAEYQSFLGTLIKKGGNQKTIIFFIGIIISIFLIGSLIKIIRKFVHRP